MARRKDYAKRANKICGMFRRWSGPKPSDDGRWMLDAAGISRDYADRRKAATAGLNMWSEEYRVAVEKCETEEAKRGS